MLERPAWRGRYRAAVVPGDGVFLLAERGHTVLTGRVFELLAPLLDGRATADELAGLLEPEIEPAETFFALLELESRGYLRDARDGSVVATGFWDLLDADAGAAESRLRQARVELTNASRLPTDVVETALRAAGLWPGTPGDLSVVFVDHYLDPGLESINRLALASRRPWALVKPTGTVLWIGPLFRPFESACWHCLAHRLRPHQAVEEFLRLRLGSGSGPPAEQGPHGALSTAVGLLATQLACWLGAGVAPALSRELWTFDLLRPGLVQHPVHRRPQCPECGDCSITARRSTAPVDLSAWFGQAPVSNWGTSFRVQSPAEFVTRHAGLIGPVTGIAPTLEPLPVGGGSVLHVYAAGTNTADVRGSAARLRAGLRFQCSGKGTTDVEARASALGEAIERYSGVFQGDESRVRASRRGLGDRAISPTECMLYSEAQYAARSLWAALPSWTAHVPRPLDPDEVLDWTPVHSLTRNEPRYLPTAYLYYNHPEGGAHGSCWADSNGTAAGGTRGEALLVGLLELIERDAVAIWWYNRIRRPAVDLELVDDPYCQAVRTEFRTAAREVWILDLTTDLAIPVFAAVSRSTNGQSEELLFGLGSHLDPLIALRRALAEVGQMWAAVEALKRNGTPPARELDAWLTAETLDRHVHLAPADGAPVPPTRSTGVGQPPIEQFRLCRQTLEAHDLEILVLDQSRADLEVPVVKVIVPGLRHFWPRLAPGRLYSVPVRLGWRASSQREDELNPIPFFL